jgi:hypothetical protein
MSENNRFTSKLSKHYSLELDFYDNGTRMSMGEVLRCLNNLNEENQLLKNKLKQIDNSLPLYLSCAEIRDFYSETYEEDIALNAHYKRVSKEEYGSD